MFKTTRDVSGFIPKSIEESSPHPQNRWKLLQEIKKGVSIKSGIRNPCIICKKDLRGEGSSEPHCGRFGFHQGTCY
ncbi:hypothetical protein NPIL_409781 [Nephila pilipes]|uniref:Uncharacterized protein n=1 Tax=Nephila pilipes TaxID=299642 RepID=A0A8X6T9X9_NEPPI|nr:hypothetical protein NPIL_409781 [Nephila pilipes]